MAFKALGKMPSFCFNLTLQHASYFQLTFPLDNIPPLPSCALHQVWGRPTPGGGNKKAMGKLTKTARPQHEHIHKKACRCLAPVCAL